MVGFGFMSGFSSKIAQIVSSVSQSSVAKVLPFRKKNTMRSFDRFVLRKNSISLLILDERWNSLFASTPKTSEILCSEVKLKELLKLQSRLLEEKRMIEAKKKSCIDNIMKLTPEVHDKNDESAKAKMTCLQKDINNINKRLEAIMIELEEMPEKVKQINLELLEHTVNVVYFKMGSARQRVKELERIIEDTRTKLKAYIEEKELLSEDDSNIYSYFHDLLGAEELEKLDHEFFGEKLVE